MKRIQWISEIRMQCASEERESSFTLLGGVMIGSRTLWVIPCIRTFCHCAPPQESVRLSAPEQNSSAVSRPVNSDSRHPISHWVIMKPRWLNDWLTDRLNLMVRTFEPDGLDGLNMWWWWWWWWWWWQDGLVAGWCKTLTRRRGRRIFIIFAYFQNRGKQFEIKKTN